MKFKIDENLPADVAEILEQSGYDTTTVLNQQLGGASDIEITSFCRKEGRALITLDTDFANIRNYPPQKFPGLIVLHLYRQDKPHVLEIIRRLVETLSAEQLDRRLWIVEEDRLRIRE
ncbi:hypothetical protein ES703_13343 [subsurface metagenome]|nr:hypothetical protein [Dehalococcoidia bacterium]